MSTTLNPSRVLGTVGLPEKRMFHGIYIASVVNNNDPMGEGRVLLHIPQVLGTAISNWADPLGYSNNYTVPAVNTIVHAYFTGGDVNYPVYAYTVDLQTPINNLQPGSWHSMILQNSWSNASGMIAGQYRTVLGGDSVEIIANLIAGTSTDNTIVATLPSGYYNSSHSHTFNADVPSGAQNTTFVLNVTQGSLNNGTVSFGILPLSEAILIPTNDHTLSGPPYIIGPSGQQFLNWDSNNQIIDSISGGNQSLVDTTLVNDQTASISLNLNTPSFTLDTSGHLRIFNCPNPSVFAGGTISFHQTIPLSA